MKRIGSFLIVAALTAAMVGCAVDDPVVILPDVVHIFSDHTLLTYS